MGRSTHGTLTLVLVALVAAIGFADDWTVGPAVVALAAVLAHPALTFAITAVPYGFIQYGASRWMLRRWNDWINGAGQRLEQHLEKWRRGRVLRHPVHWITHGSLFWFALASVIFAPVVVVGIAQLASEQPVPHRRVVLSSIIYGVWFAGLYTAIGYGIGEGARAA